MTHTYVIAFVSVALSVSLRRRPQQAGLTDLTFDSRMSPSRLIEGTHLIPVEKPEPREDKGGHAEAGEVVNRMEQPSVLF